MDTNIEELTARDVMHVGCRCIEERSTLVDAARMMASEDIGALPVCGNDDRLLGMLTDRDIVVSCIAEGRDPLAVTCAELCSKPIKWAFATTRAVDLVAMMEEHRIRRLPIIDEHHRLVGIVSLADVAKRLDREKAGEILAVAAGTTR